MKYIEKKEHILYVCYHINYYCAGYLEHHTINTDKRILSQYNFLKLEHIPSHPDLLLLLKTKKFKKVYTDLFKDTVLFKQLKQSSVSLIESQKDKENAITPLEEYQNLKGVLYAPNVSITESIKETLEKYSSLIDLEKMYFPPEIKTLSKLSYLVMVRSPY